MPLTRISLKQRRTVAHRKVITDGDCQAMRKTFNLPQDDRFKTISEFADSDCDYRQHYLGIERSNDPVIIQMTVIYARTVPQKQALFKRIAEPLTEPPGVRREDIFINLVEAAREHWSFGDSIAQ